MKPVRLFIVAVMLSQTVFATQHTIATLGDLKTLSETSSWWADTIVLTADIDADSTRHWNSDSGFSPIGNATTKFTGVFHGGNYAIKIFLSSGTPQTTLVYSGGCIILLLLTMSLSAMQT